MTFENLRRRISIRLRRLGETRIEKFSLSAIEQFRFYQFRAPTAAYFFDQLKRTDVRVIDTPHYALAAALASGKPDRVSIATKDYLAYLSASWGTADNSRLMQRVEDFRQHFEAYRSGENSRRPILTRINADGDYFVVDGNHRSAFALALGRTIEAEIWPADLAFLKYSHMKEFYGTGNRNLPYQSLFLHGQEVIKGRRNDAVKRLQMIPRHVLEGMCVLDVASNVGMSSLISHSLGARSSLGLEISPRMVDVASRFAMFEGTYPKVQFRQFDVDIDILAPDAQFDTAFMFSIYSHLKNPQNLLQIAKDNVTRYVVFEGHPNDRREQYSQFLDSGLFKSVSEIGTLSMSIFHTQPNRILWLCEK